MGKILDDKQLIVAQSMQRRFINIPSLSIFSELLQGFTTRHGGVSTEDYSTLNLNFNRPDSKSNVYENYRLLGKDLGVSPHDMVLSHQVHGKRILPVTREHAGMGIERERSYQNVDGLATSDTGLMLVTHYADCVPLYFYDPVSKVIALSHSGWKGTLLDIGGETIRVLKDVYGCEPNNLHIAFGPHIKACCFEVDNDVTQPFLDTFPWADHYTTHRAEGKWVLDLEGIIIQSLLSRGITKDHISGCKVCTRCHKELFFSHRGCQGKTGTGAAFIMIRG